VLVNLRKEEIQLNTLIRTFSPISRFVFAFVVGALLISGFVFAQVGEANLDNDPSEGDLEAYFEDPNLAPGMITTEDTDEDGDFDRIHVGVMGGGQFFGQVEMDGQSDIEIIFSDPTLDSGEIRSADADDDGDAEVIWIGTRGADFDGDEMKEVDEAGSIVAIVDIDGDGNNEIAVVDTAQIIGEYTTDSFGVRSGDDFEVFWVGIGVKIEDVIVGRGATFLEITDFDGDGENEVIFEDIQIEQIEPSFGGIFLDIDEDGDDDVIIQIR